jgi:hypothetical protein
MLRMPKRFYETAIAIRAVKLVFGQEVTIRHHGADAASTRRHPRQRVDPLRDEQCEGGLTANLERKYPVTPRSWCRAAQ